MERPQRIVAPKATAQIRRRGATEWTVDIRIVRVLQCTFDSIRRRLDADSLHYSVCLSLSLSVCVDRLFFCACVCVCVCVSDESESLCRGRCVAL